MLHKLKQASKAEACSFLRPPIPQLLYQGKKFIA
jgi:hypothetical protein